MMLMSDLFDQISSECGTASKRADFLNCILLGLGFCFGGEMLEWEG